MQNLQGKTAFVTGGASGIGLGIAKALGRAGAKVVVADVRRNLVDETVKWFEGEGYPVLGICLDVTDREAYAAAADEVERVFGKLHVLVNNAGVEVGSAKLWDFTYRDIDFITGVNFLGILNGIKTIVPRILAHGEEGHVVSTASMSGVSVVPGAGLYCATKGGVISMMETLASDLQGTKVGASAFCPGPVQTNFAANSTQVRPEGMKNDGAPASPPPPPPPPPEPPTGDPRTAGFVAPPMPDFSKALISPEEAGERVARGILRGDLYIMTHPEFKGSVKTKSEAMLRSFPDEPLDPERVNIFENFFTFLTKNPIYDAQTTPGALDRS
ncbi:MAG: SDR family NAD(P)-dependent oxidoreductase [Oscillospiraceae bacterium]|jgi:NAD(P)-dependent dehydrogenase (short-subunit alcohol dehydrogenase family)|nr:SDR family NAD(P)-dependent oxidoreductase [Oscillospiraceae bacterium]